MLSVQFFFSSKKHFKRSKAIHVLSLLENFQISFWVHKNKIRKDNAVFVFVHCCLLQCLLFSMRCTKKWIYTNLRTVGLISKKATLHMQHTFLCISLPLSCTTTKWNLQKLLSYTFWEEMLYVFSFTFFPLPPIFTLHWWPLPFLTLSPPLQNFDVVLPTKKHLLCFIISRSRSLSPFF